MHVIGVLFFAAAVLTVNARHKKEWEFVNMKKMSREIFLPYYRNEGSACTKGVGFYRDPTDCHQYIRCVDDFNTGRRLSVFVGRCRPGLVFDENISSCNWPELAAPCSNSPERFKDTESKFTPKEQNTQHVVQDNRISDSSVNRNNYQPSQQETIQKPQGLKKQSSQANQGSQKPVDQIKNVFQEDEVQGQFEQSFEEPQTQITDQVREPQISQGFEEVPNTKGQQKIPTVQQIREPVIQEKDESISEIPQIREPVVKQKTEQKSQTEESHGPFIQQQTQQIREPVIEEQTQQIREPVVQEQTQQIREPVGQEQTQQIREPVVQEQTQQIREPVVQEQTQQIREPVVQEQTQQIGEPVIQEQTQQIREPVVPEQTQQIREPVVQEQTQQIREPVVHEQTEQISQKQNTRKPIIQQQNHQEQQPSIWQETDSQEKIYQPIEKQTELPFSQDTRRNNGQQIVHQQQNTKDDVQSSQLQEQVSSGYFQEVPDSRPSQIGISPTNQQKQQAESQWWVPESQDSKNPTTFGINRETNKDRGHVAPTSLEEPILCSEEGFFRHPKNCSRFVRCVKNEHGSFSVHFFQCAKNLFFDEGISHCKDSNNVKCTTRRTKREADDTTPLECKGEGFFRHPSDCRSFYRCVKQQTGSYETHLFSCPANLVFDEEYTTCNWPDKAPPCENRRQLWKPTRPSAPARSSFKPYQRTTKGYKSTSKPRNDLFEPLNPSTSRRGSNTRTTQRPRFTTESSAKNGQLCNSPGFYSHDKDCTKFFKCVKKGNYFVRYELSCPQNFAYDENSSRCVSRRNVNSCNRRNTPFPPRQDDEESPQTTEATLATSESSQSPSGENEIKCAEEGYFRNPSDCNRFYRCVDFSGEGQEFVRYDFKCPEGLVFDETNSICNWPDQSAPCEGGGGNGGGGEGEGKGEGDKGEGETGEGEGGSEATSSLPEETSSATSRSTTSRRTTTVPTKQTERSTSSPRRTTSRPDESTSRSSETTAKPGGSTSGPGNPQSNGECPQEGYFRNPEDCNKFYRCVDFSGDGQEFVRYDFACPEGLVFDESNSVCNWPSEVEPCDSTSGGGSDKDQGDSSPSTTQRDRESTTSRPGSTKSDQSSTEVTNEESPSSSFRTEKPESSSSVTESSSSSTTSKEGSSGDKRGSTSNGECSEAGFFRNPDDCNKFYRCVDYNEDGQEFVKYDFSCPKGLVFDEENSVCNWPDQSAPCDGENNSGKDGSSTKQEENKSSTSSTTQRRGEESTQSSSTQSTTESSSDNGNEESQSTGSTSTSKQTTPPDQSTKSTTQISSTTSDDSSREESTLGETSGSGNEDNGGECSEEGFFRNPDDCGKFYRCVDFDGDGQQFVRYDFDCPQGLHFDEANSVCNWPEQSPCENGTGSTGKGGQSTDSSITSKSDSTTQQTQSETQSSSTTQSTAITKEETGATGSTTSGNEFECSEPGFFRCPGDCNKFYRCVDETGDGQQLIRYDFKCPEGLIFDEKNKRCDFPSEENPCDIESASTTPSSTQSTTTSAAQSTTTSATQSTTTSATRSTTTSAPQSTTTSATQSTTTSATQSTTTSATQSTTTSATQSTKSETTSNPTTTSISTTSSSSTTSSTKSSGECTEEGFFRDPDNCSKYYRCIDEGDGTLTREEFSCAEDEVFDEEMRFCNRKDLAPPCEEGSSTQSTSTRAQDTTAGASSTTPSGSSETSSSSSTTPSESTTKDDSQSDCTESGFFRCKEDCSNFYRCVDENGNGESYVRYNFSCPDGLIFDEKNEKCDWPSDELTCDKKTTSSSTTSSGSTSATSTPSSSTTSADSTSATSTPSSSTTSAGSSSATSTTSSPDECTEEGFFRDPNDCSKYYRCLDEGDGTLTREDFSCAEDEVFDEEMNYCNRKDLAPPCEGSSSSTTESSSQQPSSSTTRSDSSTTESKPSTTTEGTSTAQGSSSTTTESSSTTQSPSSTTTSSSSTAQSTSSTNEEGGSTEGITKGATDSSGECQEEGFHRDPNDCNKFYRCVDFRGDGQSYTRYDFECPEGLVFDETNSVCNWPSSVPSCEYSDGKSSTSNDRDATTTTGESSSSTTQDDRSQTSTTQEGASSTTTTQADKTSTTQGDISSTSTTEGDRSSTSTGTTSSSTSRDNESTGSSTSTSMTTSPSEGSTTKSPSDKESKDIECTEEGFFRNPDDCTKFYRCVDFAGTGESYVRYDFECPDDLVFDEVNSVCNWPNMSPGCESSSKDENKESKETTTEGNDSTSTSESSTDSGASQTTGITSEDSTKTTSGTSTTATSTTKSTSETTTQSDDFQCEEEGFFKHPKDCKKYYECKTDEDTGELIKIDCECPEGHVFDSDGWYCNAEELSPPCDDGSFKCEEEGFFRDPEDCTGYYHCNETGSGFRKERFQCSDGNVFDEEGRYCNAPELSEPCNSTSSTTPSSETTSSDRKTTPGSGTSSKPSTSTSSDTSSTSSAVTSSGQQEDCAEEGFFRNPEDCTKYYQCSRIENSGNFERSDFTCPDGRVFDEGSNYCNDPELSEEPCETGSTTGSTTQAKTESSDSSTTSSGTTNSNTASTTEHTTKSDSSSTGTTAGPGTGTRRSGGDPECKQEGFFRHPKDCNKFYRCVDFSGSGESYVRYDFDCPEGLHFDEVNSVCNWPTMTPPCSSDESDNEF